MENSFNKSESTLISLKVLDSNGGFKSGIEIYYYSGDYYVRTENDEFHKVDYEIGETITIGDSPAQTISITFDGVTKIYYIPQSI